MEDVDCGARSGLNSISGLTLSWVGSAVRSSQAPSPVPTPKTATQPAIETGRATFANFSPQSCYRVFCGPTIVCSSPRPSLPGKLAFEGHRGRGNWQSEFFLSGTSGGMKRAESLARVTRCGPLPAANPRPHTSSSTGHHGCPGAATSVSNRPLQRTVALRTLSS